MDPKETIYILGCGAIGLPLAVFLVNAGRNVIAVRTSRDAPKRTLTVSVRNGTDRLNATLELIPLSELNRLDGIIVIAAKSYANNEIAQQLKNRNVAGPIVILQNGLGVEKPFREAGFFPIYRCILYATSQPALENEFTFSLIAPCPIGVVSGDESNLGRCVEELTTDEFPFHSEANIQREIWKKAIINSVFNSICPLLEVDNGIFARDEETANLAREIVRECVMLTDRLNMGLSESELMEQIMRISRGSSQLISTLQDIRKGRQTEIESLNLEIARVAASMQPIVHLPRIELLGKMILAKSLQQRGKET